MILLKKVKFHPKDEKIARKDAKSRRSQSLKLFKI